jgi:peptidyl-prolyl cis-trans isomerase SurA
MRNSCGMGAYYYAGRPVPARGVPRGERGMIRSVLLALVVLVGGVTVARAQEPAQGPDLVDRVVAVVGDSVILASELDEQIERRRALGEPLPTDPGQLEELRRQELEALINELIMLQAAARDSIAVPASDVEGQVEATVQEQVRRFGSRAAFEEALEQEGITLDEYRALIGRSARRAGIRQQFMATIQRDRTPPPVTDDEIRAFFEQRREELGRRPGSIEFKQVVVTPEPSDSAMAEARAEAEGILEELQQGEDFATLARRHSDDPGTRQQGGELGWFRRGRFVPAFERVAFALPPGRYSGIVETSFGLHIIKVERARGPERLARHILIRPELTSDDFRRTRERAEDVAAALRDGASIDSLIEAVHDPVEQSQVGPAIQDSLPAPWRTELRGARPDEVVGPFEIPAAQESYAVVRVTDVIDAGEYTLGDQALRAQIRQFLQRERLLEEVLNELRSGTYIDVRY